MTLACSTAFAAEADSCAVSHTAKVAFTSKLGTDIVTATAIPGPVKPGEGSVAVNPGTGPNCILSAVALTITKSDGTLLNGFVTSLAAANFDAGHMMEPQSPEAVDKFFAEWTKVELSTTDKAPKPGDEFETTLDDETYKAVRDRKDPMLCYMEDNFTKACIFSDSTSEGYVQPFFRQPTGG
ncbi:hypothetical protein sos41_16460 [Alphaproteobacteria bacterium SO-S41]|nr:hypothetical protein sos41_16460 [Alphaproteobacteria bacterium SO-S41]